MGYRSEYGAERELTAAQRIAEICVARMIIKGGKEPPPKFWKIPEYSKQYQIQIRAANKLLKVYDAAAIIGYLSKNSWVFSVSAAWVHKEIEKEQGNIDRAIVLANTTNVVVGDNTSVGNSGKSVKTMRGKLKGL